MSGLNFCSTRRFQRTLCFEMLLQVVVSSRLGQALAPAQDGRSSSAPDLAAATVSAGGGGVGILGGTGSLGVLVAR